MASSKSSIPASKARAGLCNCAKKYVKSFKDGDTTLVVHIPGQRQGHIICIEDGMTAEQFVGALKALQTGFKNPDPRLEKLIVLAQDRADAEQAVTGGYDQW